MGRAHIHLIRSDGKPPQGLYELSWHLVDIGRAVARCGLAETIRHGAEWRSHLKLVNGMEPPRDATPRLMLADLLKAGWRRVDARSAAAFVRI